MKVLLAHNFYRSSAPSGEDAVYHNERAMLEKHHDVIVYERHNDDIDVSSLSNRIRVALQGAWSQRSYHELSRLIRRHRPQLAHFHNTFPLISPSAYFACRDNNVPVVQTLHNYRFICPNALLMRGGAPCEACVGKNLLPALRYRCYRDSVLATAAQVWTLVINRSRGTYQTLVDRYIALTEFAAGRLIAGCLPADRVLVKPNFLPNVPLPGNGGGGYAIYVGRLSEEKGVRTLMAAWRDVVGLPLKLVGDGPLKDEIVAFLAAIDLPITWLGYQSRAAIIELVREASMLIVPSQCYEGFPMVVLEAFACGTPVVASDIGSLREIVREGVTGFKFEPGNTAALAQAVNAARCNDETLQGMRAAARKTFEENFTEDVNYRQLLAVYEEALGSASHRTRE